MVFSLENILLLSELVDSLSAHLVLLLQCQFSHHAVFLLFVEPPQFLLLLVNGQA